MALAVALATLAGCEKAGIEHYQVPEPAAVHARNHVTKPQALQAMRQPAATTAPTRMLAAIAPRGDNAWFFKLSGPAEPVGRHLDEFQKFMLSVRFGDSGTPAWKAPEGWNEGPPNPNRVATLIIPASPPLEVTVTELPWDLERDAEQRLANINRWRGQVNLPPIEAADLEGESTSREVDGVRMTMIDILGEGPGAMSPPFASHSTPPIADDHSPVDAARTAAPDMPKFTLPEGWRSAQNDVLSMAAFQAGPDAAAPRVTISLLSALGGELLPNVNRWRGQLGLPQIKTDELAKDLQSIKVDDASGQYVTLTSAARGNTERSIFGVIVVRGPHAWVFKLAGAKGPAAQEKANFEAFVKSIQFPAQKG